MSEESAKFIREQSALVLRTLILLASLASILVGLGVPALVATIGVLNQQTSLADAVARRAAVVSRYVYSDAEMWQYEELRLSELLRNISDELAPAWFEVVTADGTEVLQLGTRPGSFSVSSASPVRDGSPIVGTLRGAVSLKPVLFQTLLTTLGSIPLGGALFAALWLGPNRVSRLSFARLMAGDRALAESAASLNKAQRIAKMGSWEWDSHTERMRWSEEGLRIFGFTDGATDRDPNDWEPYVHPDDLESIRVAYDLNWETGELQRFVYRLQRPDGTTSIIEEQIEAVYDGDGRMTAQSGVLQDISDRKALEAQLAQAVKMEAIGKLTGGMAHDFNNYLAVIVGNLDMLKLREPGNPATTKLLDAALGGALRATELTKSLLAFSRQQPLDPALTDVNQRLGAVLGLLNRTLGEDITFTAQFAPDLWPVKIDGAQFDSCIVNLANNARDAMPRGGSITISSRNMQLDEQYTAMNAEVAPGEYALIEISDTGTGMSPETQARVFEPFFTTKARDHGTGLGLSMAHGFVRQSGGHILVYSELGLGTTVRIYLPRTREAGAIAAVASAAPAAVPPGTGTILVVEDNEMMRRTAVAQLTSFD